MTIERVGPTKGSVLENWQNSLTAGFNVSMSSHSIMSRPLRIEYAGAVYHVMARGNQGRAIFRDDQDRQRYLDTVGEGCENERFCERRKKMGENTKCHFSRTDPLAQVILSQSLAGVGR